MPRLHQGALPNPDPARRFVKLAIGHGIGPGLQVIHSRWRPGRVLLRPVLHINDPFNGNNRAPWLATPAAL